MKRAYKVMSGCEKNVYNMLTLVKGDITKKQNWPNGKIDTIVNAANPTLMGSNQGVDGAIHSAVDNFYHCKGKMNSQICDELGTEYGRKVIRCKRGEAVITKGHEYCRWIIHAVGFPYDGICNGAKRNGIKNNCSSTCISRMESCYFNIINEVKKHLDIEVLGIPIIGAGEYGFPFELAVNIAIACTGNALIEWKKEDKELFELSSLKEVRFFIYDIDGSKCEEYFREAEDTLRKYDQYFSKEKRVVFQNTLESLTRYLVDIRKYDKRRGYFAIARSFRNILIMCRFLFDPFLFIFKDFFYGKRDWERRRQAVELITIFKAVFPLLSCMIVHASIPVVNEFHVQLLLNILVIYMMADTISYLLVLIFMADIQRPSANKIRSIIMLFFNYIEIGGSLTFLCFQYYKTIKTNFTFGQALAYGFVGQSCVEEYKTCMDYVFLFLDVGLKFFFLTLVFGYFFDHMRQRRFKS